MALLSNDGLLVLEISIASEGGDDWVKVKRSIDERFFPTRAKLGSMLQDYAWKVIGHSVNQAGDPLQRYVVHVRKMRPYAYLMMETPGSGKSTISRRLFKQAKVPVVGGDRVYLQVSEGKHEASDALRQAISEGFTTASIDKATTRVFESGLADEIVDLWIKQAGKQDFALDSYVPEAHQKSVREALFRKGYFPVDLNWSADAELMTPSRSTKKASDYETWLGKQASLNTRPSLNVSRLLPHVLKPSIRWHLDHPVSGQLFVEDQTMKVAGWVVTFEDYQQLLQLYVETARGRRLFEFDRSRKDVLNAVFGSLETTPPFWQDQPCGFSFEVTKEDVSSGFEIGLVVSKQSIPLARVSLPDVNDGDSRRLGARLAKRLRKLKG
jgi:adenylate kinase family enzyme